MAEDPQKPNDGTTMEQPMRQSCAGGVPDRKWFVAIVRRNYERVCRTQLAELGYEAYVASQKQTHVYRNRHRREVEHIVITGIVFVRITDQERLQVLKQCQHIQCFMLNRTGQSNPYGRSPFAVIPDSQMATLQFMLYHADTPVTFTNTPLRCGDRIRIIRGCMQGYKGDFLRQGNDHYIVVNLDLLGCAMTTISADDIEKIC